MRKEEESIMVEEQTLEEVEHFYYLNDTLDCEGGHGKSIKNKSGNSLEKVERDWQLLLNKNIKASLMIYLMNTFFYTVYKNHDTD